MLNLTLIKKRGIMVPVKFLQLNNIFGGSMIIHFDPTPQNVKLLVCWLIVIFAAIGTAFGLWKAFKDDGDKKKKEPATPVFLKERTECPFHGFASVGSIMMDTDGNQCALCAGFVPCGMEMKGEYPSWEKCDVMITPNKEKFIGSLSKVTVFPDEFFPPNKKKWSGKSFTGWYSYIVGETKLSPERSVSNGKE